LVAEVVSKSERIIYSISGYSRIAGFFSDCIFSCRVSLCLIPWQLVDIVR